MDGTKRFVLVVVQGGCAVRVQLSDDLRALILMAQEYIMHPAEDDIRVFDTDGELVLRVPARRRIGGGRLGRVRLPGLCPLRARESRFGCPLQTLRWSDGTAEHAGRDNSLNAHKGMRASGSGLPGTRLCSKRVSLRILEV